METQFTCPNFHSIALEFINQSMKINEFSCQTGTICVKTCHFVGIQKYSNTKHNQTLQLDLTCPNFDSMRSCV